MDSLRRRPDILTRSSMPHSLGGHPSPTAFPPRAELQTVAYGRRLTAYSGATVPDSHRVPLATSRPLTMAIAACAVNPSPPSAHLALDFPAKAATLSPRPISRNLPPSPPWIMNFDNSYARLPERFYSTVEPRKASTPETLLVNDDLARRLDIDPEWLESDEGAAFITGNHIAPGSEPIALVYAGHQFGNWVPRLGDGRAVLLGEIVDGEGQRVDLQLKGSGRTPYARRGDGLAPLGPVLREYLIAEAMHALKIPTTRALAAAATGDTVRRDGLLPGGVILRTASSHLRIGTLEYFASRGDGEALNRLVDYAMERHYPQREATPIALLDAVADATADLVARWQLNAFVHGVMNTDNMLLCGETIDYGPCAFMNDYDPATVYSSIDRHGRYAYGNQPGIAQWNISRMAQALMPAIEDDKATREAFLNDAQAIVDDFPHRFQAHYTAHVAPKLGLHAFAVDGDDDGDWALIDDLLKAMHEHELDFTLTFRGLTAHIAQRAGLDADEAPEIDDDLFHLPDALTPWLDDWRTRLRRDPLDDDERHALMAAHNPAFIPRNHRVDQALEAAVHQGDLNPFIRLHKRLQDPFRYDPDDRDLATPPAPEEEIDATFCGT